MSALLYSVIYRLPHRNFETLEVCKYFRLRILVLFQPQPVRAQKTRVDVEIMTSQVNNSSLEYVNWCNIIVCMGMWVERYMPQFFVKVHPNIEKEM